MDLSDIRTITWLAVAVGTALIGYVTFRVSQKAKNEALDTRIGVERKAINVQLQRVDKDITKNDDRLRGEIADQNVRNTKAADEMQIDIRELQNNRILTDSRLAKIEVDIDHIKSTGDKTADGVGKLVESVATLAAQSKQSNGG